MSNTQAAPAKKQDSLVKSLAKSIAESMKSFKKKEADLQNEEERNLLNISNNSMSRRSSIIKLEADVQK